MLEANLHLFSGQGQASAAIKNLHTCAALRVVFFATALFRSPPAQVFCLYQRPNEGFAEMDLIEQIF
ncbi:hypothetical protein HYN43_003270 [Mucilaginibacter celer]|uniref:Uncharacterized protein n=1 Tax=Mucilaginibacter celer TaxID=2305508 RepID=A0A494VHV3_9SPHI|nr:hypothetical protein HYN43_003270 [Mucilaginibacter celer]